MTTGFMQSIANLADASPGRHVDAIKQLVANRFRESDSDVDVYATEYFNHTYTPDLVLSWPGEASRNVFLRTTTRQQYLLEDIDAIGEMHPIIMPLGDLDGTDERGGESIDASRAERTNFDRKSVEARTLVANPQALESLAEAAVDAPVVGLLSRAVLQGGRGLVGEGRAAAAGATVGDGFVAASQGSADDTGRAVDLVDGLLDGFHASRINRLLQAVWIASGAPATGFPGAVQLTANLDRESLQFLLAGADIDDYEFWARLARGLTLGRLIETTIDVDSENLQRLVRAALPHLSAKACVVLIEDQATTDLSLPRWTTTGRALGLIAQRYSAFASTYAAADMGVTLRSSDAVTVPDLVSRVDQAQVTLSEIELEGVRGQRVGVSNADGDLSRDELLTRLGDALGVNAAVRRVVVGLETGQSLRCDLTKGVAAGRTVAKYRLDDLLDASILILKGTTTRERDELATVLGLF
ncbi:hypothetical protein ACFVWG_33465 [Kribbella sp. NPDC058245]|uniref:hypothetical protein n=1 Tax=Kribbella sp. NPDC058245 TaxID=3346399 RepID=UPI0036EF1E5B